MTSRRRSSTQSTSRARSGSSESAAGSAPRTCRAADSTRARRGRVRAGTGRHACSSSGSSGSTSTTCGPSRASKGHHAAKVRPATGLASPRSSWAGAWPSTTPGTCPAREAASSRNGEGSTGDVAVPFQWDVLSQRRLRARVNATYASRRSSRAACASTAAR